MYGAIVNISNSKIMLYSNMQLNLFFKSNLFFLPWVYGVITCEYSLF